MAAVSSFGAGGANAHVIVHEEAPRPRPVAEPEGGPVLVVLSARRQERLEELAGNLLRFLRSERGAGSSIADVAWTLMIGREAFEHRLALVASSRDELGEQLEAFADGRAVDAFTGQPQTYEDARGGESAADRDYLRALLAGGQLTRLAELWVQGWTVDWEQLHERPPGRTVSLPTYPFARDRYWIAPEDYRPGGNGSQPAGRASPAAEPAPTPAAEREPAAAAEPAAEAGDFREALEHTVKTIFSELHEASRRRARRPCGLPGLRL